MPVHADDTQPAAGRASLRTPWYRGVTRYQWLILVIASAGWVFDAFEGQVFTITRVGMLTEIVQKTVTSPDELRGEVAAYGDVFVGVFLVGGALGGIVFGVLADRWGRKPVMVLTILFYSVFAGLTFFVTALWQVGVLRFFVAMGVGGEWAVAAALVAEVFPQHARAHASGLFHATSCMGTPMAMLVGLAVGAQWRYAYVVSIIPALLVVWVWTSVKEPESWILASQKAAASGAPGAPGREKLGSLRELLLHRVWGPRALMGMVLAAAGLATFWAVSCAGQDLAKDFLVNRSHYADADAEAWAKFAYGAIEVIGWGAGMFSFGPLCVRLGRRATFILFQALSLVVVPLTCYGPSTFSQLLFLLPLYGFATVAIQAGFAIYFPELFPSHLRSTGAGFCFNAGRLLAAPALFLSGPLKRAVGLHLAIELMSLLFLVGIVAVFFMPETKGQPLPE